MVPREKQAFAWGVLASVVFHALLFIAFPFLRDAAARRLAEPPGVVIARLVEPAPAPAEKPPAPPMAADEQIPKAPPKRAAPPKPTPRPKPVPPAERRVAPAEPPVPKQAPAPAEASAPRSPVPEPAIQARPAEQVAGSEARTPAAAPPSGAPEDNHDISFLVGKFKIALVREMKRDLEPRYRRLTRHHEALGKGEVLLVIGEGGAMSELRMARSTGDALLDRASLESVERSKERVAVPPGLHGRRFTLRIPVEFNLSEE